jgi:nucleoside-diphosphate-sugar epimerase
VGWDGDVVPVPADALPEHLRAPGDWRYELVTDTRRLRDELNYEAPVTMDEALRRTAEWERAQRAATDAPDYAAEDAVLENGH